MRRRHPKKEVEATLRSIERLGWMVTPTRSGHRWGAATCGRGCVVSIWSTPRSPGNHAKAILRAFDRCPHVEVDRD
jgi:hypothetical protein